MEGGAYLPFLLGRDLFFFNADAPTSKYFSYDGFPSGHWCLRITLVFWLYSGFSCASVLSEDMLEEMRSESCAMDRFEESAYAPRI